MEPVLIECTLCHKRYRLDLEKMRQMGVVDPACPACKTPLPIPPPSAEGLSPSSRGADAHAVGDKTGPISGGAVARAKAAAAATAVAPTAVAARSQTEATGELSTEKAARAITPPPAAPPAIAPPAPPPDPPPANELDFEAPDIGESTISSAMMAGQLSKMGKLPEGYNFTLSCIDGAAAGKKLTLAANRCVVGRRKGDFVLTGDGEASGEHACIEIKKFGDYFLTDMNSTNGTFLNDKKISGTVPLHDRDVIRIGGCTLLFVVTVDEEEHTVPASGVVPAILPPPPGVVAPAAPAPIPPPAEAAPAIPDLPAFLPKPTPVPPNYRFYLKFMEGDMTGEVFEMKGGRGYTMGRSRDCDIPIGDIKASRAHARIFILGVDKYFTQDLGSTNGTFINEQKVLDVLPLKNQDLLRIGLTKMKFIVLKLPPGQQSV